VVLRSVIRFPAVLRGTGEAGGAGAMCVLETWSERSSKGRRFTRCRITDEPAELPDGTYVIEFDARRVATKKNHGHWDLTYLDSDSLAGYDDLERGDAA
jgi:hypothetical protein